MQIGSREFDFLCACAAVEISAKRAARIASIDPAQVNWDELLRLAEHHGVLPLVTRSLKQQQVQIPLSIAAALDKANADNLKRSLWFAGELSRILHHFSKRGVRAMPYKGPMLAESAYGDLNLRSFNDLDFLIAPKDSRAAQQALAELDYYPSEAWSPPVERFWLKKGYERAFDGKAGKYLVELQWALLPYFLAVDLRNEDLLVRSSHTGTVPQVRARSSLGANLGEENTLCLSPEDWLLVLCLHAAKHLWTRLIWICDIAESMRSEAIDYPVLIKRAEELGVRRMVAVSFWLAEHLCDADLPRAVQEVVAGDREIAVLGELFAERLAREASYDFESPEYFVLISRLRERPADRFRYLWRLLWTPGVGDLAAVKLPEPLFPLYRAVRMARLARKLIRTGFRR